MQNKINSTDYLNNLIKNLPEDGKIEINKTGTIKIIHFDSTGKKKSQKIGNLFTNMEETPLVKFRTTSFVNINTPAFKSYRTFGKQKPINRDFDSNLIIGIFETLVSMNLSIIPGKFTDSQGLKYTTKQISEYVGYYGISGTLHFVVKISENKRYWNNTRSPLNTKKFESLDKVK